MNEPTSTPPAPPQLSPDGRFYWSGTEWLPAPVAGKRPARGWTVGSTILTLIALGFALVGWALLTATMPTDIAALGGLFGLIALAVGVVVLIVVIVTAATPAKS